MRIALVVHKFPPVYLGGTEVYTLNLARALAAQHQVAVLYRDDGDGMRAGVEIHEREGFQTWRVARAFNPCQANPAALFFDTFFNPDIEQIFRRFLVEFQPDLIHFQHLMSLSYRLPALAAGIPVLLTLHDYWFLCANSQLIWPDMQICRGKAWGMNCAHCATARAGGPLLRLARPLLAPVMQLRDALVRSAALRLGRFVSPSYFLRERYLATGFPKTHFEVLENGIDLAKFSAPSVPRLANAPLRVTYLGSLAWQKGVHVLLEAARGISPEQLQIRVFGNPHTFPDYVTQLRAVADPALVTFEGVVDNAAVGQVLAETDLLAVPSLWYENSPVVIQEARAVRVPVIASRIGALTEKVHDGEDGVLVAPGDIAAWNRALMQLVAAPEILFAMRDHSPAPLSFADHLSQLQQIYARVR
ncbi:MAG: glycosyltransferase family 4 protein [Anaerolineae bacterium]|nr:glycosyltransferase family 4 protein [Anaerolineae bacterium]